MTISYRLISNDDDYDWDAALRNLKITSMFFNKDEGHIVINNKYALIPKGDCCSTSWIEHYELPEAGEITKELKKISIDTIDTEDGDASTYFYKLITDKGSYDIEMRHESNGYYGGWLGLYHIIVS